jgi:adenylate kinase
MKAICKKIPRTVLFLGPPGSGKDTQAEKLSELCGHQVIGTGQMFRDEYEKKTPEGLEAFEYWGKGLWVPDDLVYELFRNLMKEYDPSKPWVFSETVRTIPQIQLFDELLSEYNRNLDRVIFLSLSSESIIERLSLRRYCPKCGRHYHLKYDAPKKEGVCDDDGEKLTIRDDEKPEFIKRRMNEFETKVKPVVEKYRERGVLLEIDAEPSIEEIHKTLVERLSNEA